MTLDSSFWSRALATLLGTVAGFLFSIALFYISERVKRRHDRAKIMAGLKRETAFNIALCDAWLKGIGDIGLKVAAGDRNIVTYFDYTRALRIFVREAVTAGVLYDLLSDDELVALDKGLLFLGDFAEQDINKKVGLWKTEGEGITAADMSQTLQLHQFGISEARRAMDQLRRKVA